MGNQKGKNNNKIQEMTDLIIQNGMAEFTPEPIDLEDEDLDTEDIVPYTANVTSIDIMTPEKEREILQKNVELFDNTEEMQKTLKKAETNLQLKHKIRTLNMIDYLTDMIDDTSKVLTEAINRDDIKDYIRRMIEEGDYGKALKEISIMNKANIDARNELLKGINPNRSKKQSKIAVKFTNNSGEETSFFAEM